MFIDTISEAEAEGQLHELYEGDQASFGFVPDHAKVFSLRPDVLAAWRAFQGSIRGHMRLRRYELVTLASARSLGCRYCQLAHGAVLTNNGVEVAQLRAILSDFHDAGLDPKEVAIMDFACKVARSADQMTQADTDALRAVGLTDTEILDVTMVAAMRCFASNTFDALGAGPDAATAELERQISDVIAA
jgi:uncharacterized peroxidase-related enzyme